MTDYLEPITENGSDALWEAEQRLAAALAGLEELYQRPRTRTGEEPEPFTERAVMDDLPLESGHPITKPTVEEKRDEALEDAAQLPLAAAVELLDLATEQGLSTVTGEGTKREPSLYPSRGNGAYAVRGDGLEHSDDGTQEQKRPFPFSEYGRPTDMQETTQAERLDQLFRRDSRRYDSGFFLY